MIIDNIPTTLASVLPSLVKKNGRIINAVYCNPVRFNIECEVAKLTQHCGTREQ